MKTTVFCLALFFLVFTGCNTTAAPPDTETTVLKESVVETKAPWESTIETTEKVEEPTAPQFHLDDRYASTYKLFLSLHEDDCYGSMPLPGGGILVMLAADKEQYDENELYLAMALVRLVEGKAVVRGMNYLKLVEGKVPIFYDEDWDTKKNPSTCPSYESGFMQILPEYGDAVLIMVFPNRVPGVRFEDSEFNGLKPSDTLGSAPMKIHTPKWNEGYPAWFFLVENKDVDDSYELHYGDFVLTGADIRSQSWTIGNAKELWNWD